MSRPGWIGECSSAIALTIGLVIMSTAGVGSAAAQPKSAPDQPPTQEAPPKQGSENNDATDGKNGTGGDQPKTRRGREQRPPTGCPAIGDKLELLV